MMEFLIFVAVAFSLPVLVLGLLQLVAPQSSLHEGVRRRLAQFKLWQLVVAVILCGLLFSRKMTSVGSPIVPFWVLVLLVGAWLFRCYCLARLPELERSRDSEADVARERPSPPS